MQHPSSKPSVPSEVLAGQAVYTHRTLKVYDAWVLGVSNYLLWRCPTHRLLQFYQQHIRGEHLELGVGTAFYPAHSLQPAPQRLVLVDLNPQTLAYAQARLGRVLRSYQRNALEPLDLPEQHFDSIAINYLLHCVPSPMRDKACLFDHAAAYLNKGGILFGSTLLQGGVTRSWPARGLMALYNRRGIFHNQADGLAELQQALAQRFVRVHVEVHGCAALFWAIKSYD